MVDGASRRGIHCASVDFLPRRDVVSTYMAFVDVGTEYHLGFCP
jgi:hypothetical protein